MADAHEGQSTFAPPSRKADAHEGQSAFVPLSKANLERAEKMWEASAGLFEDRTTGGTGLSQHSQFLAGDRLSGSLPGSACDEDDIDVGTDLADDKGNRRGDPSACEPVNPSETGPLVEDLDVFFELDGISAGPVVIAPTRTKIAVPEFSKGNACMLQRLGAGQPARQSPGADGSGSDGHGDDNVDERPRFMGQTSRSAPEPQGILNELWDIDGLGDEGAFGEFVGDLCLRPQAW